MTLYLLTAIQPLALNDVVVILATNNMFMLLIIFSCAHTQYIRNVVPTATLPATYSRRATFSQFLGLAPYHLDFLISLGMSRSMRVSYCFAHASLSKIKHSYEPMAGLACLPCSKE
jgi:hypothetical protein